MTAKEKAQDLVNKFRLSAIFTDSYVKAIAKTAVDEIINGYEFDSLDIEHKRIMDNINFWDEVKKEIEKL
jgi:hypothetical protein